MMEKSTKFEFILVRYGELTLKGKNRRQFEQQLLEQIIYKMNDLQVKIERTRSRIMVYLNGEDVAVVSARLNEIFGISSYSPAMESTLDIEEIKHTSLLALQQTSPFPRTFKVNVKRAYKSFLYDSQQLNHMIGGYIHEHEPDLKVDLYHPEVEVLVEIREHAVYMMCQRYLGAGGLPVGSSGRGMLMLSGGIDSPVAGYLALKRGLRIEAVHFHSYPFTSERAQQKVIDLCKELSRYVAHMTLHMVPFTEVLTEIRRQIPDYYSMTIMRRMMLRVTERLAEQRRALGIVTGENMGQVASQTLASLHSINEVSNFPIIRPLITMDKLEIIDIAQKIGTYDTSILPYDDCCTVFQPKAPKTKPKREAVNRWEQRIDVDQLVNQALERSTYTMYADEQRNNRTGKSLFAMKAIEKTDDLF